MKTKKNREVLIRADGFCSGNNKINCDLRVGLTAIENSWSKHLNDFTTYKDISHI